MSEAYYRANLEACWRMAAKTPHELERRAWLDLAASWRLLIITEGRCSTGEDDFDADEARHPQAIASSPMCAAGLRGKPDDTFPNIARSARRQRALSIFFLTRLITSAHRRRERHRDAGSGLPFWATRWPMLLDERSNVGERALREL